MLPYLVKILSAIDELPRFDWTNECMWRVIGVRRKAQNYTNFDLPMISRVFPIGTAADDVCRWRGVTCDPTGIVRGVTWNGNVPGSPVPLQYMYLGWLPYTVTHILIIEQRKARKDVFDTRQLPRRSIFVQIPSCRLRGSVDTLALPNDIEVLYLMQNSLSGTIFIGKLPPKLRDLNLLECPIEWVVVDNSLLTNVFQYALFSQEKTIQQLEINREGTIDQRIMVEKIDWHGRSHRLRYQPGDIRV
mmetsp:Transcript_8519/g.12907  ORF Transcript_8519/g.12907 Transcript_8519/m.12907 type:complete len:246 (-) Transcript_8519:47-784(-)